MTKYVDENKLKKLCKIARIEIKTDEIQKYLDLINNSLKGIESLNDINTEGLDPIVNPYDMALRVYSDIVNDGEKVDELMKCAPKELYNYFVVPKVIDK